MEINTIKTWLLWLGAEFDVREAHNRFRSGMKPPADYFVFSILSSQATSDNAVETKTTSSYDNSTTYSKRYKTLVDVSCYSENALTIMQSLDASTADYRVRAILGDAIAGLGLVSPIEDTTEYDETAGEVARQTRYTATFEFNEMVDFTKNITNDVWDQYEITGTITDDNDDDTTVTASFTTGDPNPPEL